MVRARPITLDMMLNERTCIPLTADHSGLVS